MALRGLLGEKSYLVFCHDFTIQAMCQPCPIEYFLFWPTNSSVCPWICVDLIQYHQSSFEPTFELENLTRATSR